MRAPDRNTIWDLILRRSTQLLSPSTFSVKVETLGFLMSIEHNSALPEVRVNSPAEVMEVSSLYACESYYDL